MPYKIEKPYYPIGVRGPAQVLFVNDDLYIMQRPGTGHQSGLILC